jgi:hypothetical protein
MNEILPEQALRDVVAMTAHDRPDSIAQARRRSSAR